MQERELVAEDCGLATNLRHRQAGVALRRRNEESEDETGCFFWRWALGRRSSGPITLYWADDNLFCKIC